MKVFMLPSKNLSLHCLDKVSALRSADFFSGLSPDILEQFAGLAVISRLRRGEVLFYQEDESCNIYVVAQGALRCIRQNAQGREQILGIEREGATLCLAPAFNGGKNFASAIADECSTLLCIEKRALLQICSKHPAVLWNVARVLAHQLQRHAQLIEALALRTVEQRVAWYLLVKAQDAAVPSGQGCVFELKATRSQIASGLGSVREVISRSLLHLQERGLISLSGRMVTVPSERVLREFASAELPHSHATEFKA